MHLGTLSMLGLGLILLAAPAQAVPCESDCGGNGASSARDDRGASSFQLTRTQHPGRGLEISLAQLSGLPTAREEHSRRAVDFVPPGLLKKQDLAPSHPGKSYLRGLRHRPARVVPGPAIPEPTALVLFGVGLLVLQAVRPVRPGRRT